MNIIEHQENIMDQKHINMLCDHMSTLTFPWFILPRTGNYNQPESSYSLDDNKFSFAHTLVNERNVNSSEIWKFDKLLHELYKRFNIDHKIYNIDRIRLGLITKVSDVSLEHEKHIDFDHPHKTLLFYFNDSTGNTKFYSRDISDNNVSREIQPKSNNAYLFDGTIYHSSSTPYTNNFRFVLNINIVEI